MERFAQSAALFALIFLSGFSLMGFEMLGSRYLNPYFGSGITTWACLISVVLFAMMVGYSIGGIVADRSRQIWILAAVLCSVGLYFVAVSVLASDALERVMLTVGYGFLGTMVACIGLTFLPVALLAALSPFFVRLMLKELRYGGRVTGAVYGVSTMGNVVGTLVTVFVFIPTIGTSAITMILGGVLIASGGACAAGWLAGRQWKRASAVLLGMGCALAVPGTPGADDILRRFPALYPEGPLWLDGRLYVAEMTAHRVSVLADDGLEEFWRRQGCGPTSVARYTHELLAVSCHLSGRITFVDRNGEEAGELTHIAGVRLRSPNDIHATGNGYMFVTDPGKFEQSELNRGHVYYHAEDGTEAVVVRNLRYPNGVAFDAGTGTLLVSEHLAQRVLAFDLDQDQKVVRSHVALGRDELFPEGSTDPLAGPDGLRLSSHGALHVALYGAGRVLVRVGDGSSHVLHMPFPYVTSMAVSERALAVVGAFKNDRSPMAGEVIVMTWGE